jgi:hypothetical protein
MYIGLLLMIPQLVSEAHGLLLIFDMSVAHIRFDDQNMPVQEESVDE